MIKLSLEPQERETIISWTDDDDRIHIYTSQKKIITKLQRNPQFELIQTRKNPQYHQNPLSIEGFLPINAVTLRRSSKAGKKPKHFTPTQFLKKETKKRGDADDGH